MIRNLFDSQPKYDSNRIAAIKAWAAEAFQLQGDTTVLVTELRCRSPAVRLWKPSSRFGSTGHPRQHKIHKALAEVTFADVLDAAKSHNQE